MLADLPASMTPGWQSVDLAARALKTALRAEDMQRAEKVVAALQSVLNVLEKLISAYTTGTPGGASTPESAGSPVTEVPASADADSQPGPSSSDDGGL